MSPLQEQFKRNQLALFIAYIPCLAFFMLLALQNAVPISYLTRDPAEIMNTKSYIGLVSNLGVLVWSATAAISLFTALVLYRAHRDLRVPLYFLVSAGITCVLLFDDLLMLHERFGPNRLHLPQQGILALYAGMMLSYLIVFRATILKTDVIFLLLCLGFLGVSALTDMITDIASHHKHHLLEDGAKFFGIVSWFCHITLGAAAHLRQAIEPPLTPPLPKTV